MKTINSLQKSYSLPDRMVVSDGMSGNYDLRKSIVSEVLGHETSVEEGGSMPFFKEAYLKAVAEYRGHDTSGWDLQKALTTTLSTYSAGTLPVLIPVYVDPEIVDLTRRATPLVELIPRVTNYGKTADYNQITVISTAQPLPEDAAITEQNDTYVRRSVSIKYLYSSGRVTGPMFAASKQYLSGGGYVDALSLEVKNKTLALKRLEEAMILLGDSATAWTEPVNSTSITAAYSFDGLYNIITDANSCTLGGSSSYKTDMAGATLGISNMRTAIRTARTAGGEPNLMVCDYATYDHIKSLIQDQLRYVSTQTIAWGITTVSFEGIPLIASRFLSTTAGTGSGVPADARSLFVLDTNVIEMRVLQDVSYEESAKTNDSIKFWLKCYETLVVKAPQFNHVIIDIGA
uniref:Putative structural protein n=1 Tax=viral metagenome TaxID=1070528 RepID=A0A6M3XUP1_9ZZZZ